MKKKLLLLPLLAALTFASCSNDDLSTNGGEKPGTGDLRYLAVNIVTPNESAKQPMSRASFEAGTDDENAVTSALFILLDNTKVAQAPVKVTGDALNPWTNATETLSSVEKISSAVLVIDGQNTKPENITGILAVLNPTTEIAGKIAIDMTLDEVKAIVDNCSTTGTSGSFVMSNSAYVDDNAVQLAAEVTVDNLKTTPELAKGSPVNIYVERAVAKIKTNALTEMTVGEADNVGNVKVDMVDENGTVTSNNLKIDIQGVQIANCAQTSYLFKNIDGFTTDPFNGWNDAANHRSYWANIPSGVTYENYSWNEISGVGDGNAAIKNAHAFYAQENIVNSGLEAVPGHTAVIVTAQLKQNDAAIDLVKIADKYYTSNGALKQLAGFLNNLGYRVKTESTPEGATTPVTKYETLADNSLAWLENALANTEVWEGFAQLNATYAMGKTFVKYNAASANEDKYDESSAEAINEVLKGDTFSVLMWKGGRCYYFVDIEHFGKVGEADNQVNLKGIIRNHVYDLNLKTLKGLGVPVFDPNVEIIPKKPTEGEYFYLAAKINILKWVLVNQDVNFN